MRRLIRNEHFKKLGSLNEMIVDTQMEFWYEPILAFNEKQNMALFSDEILKLECENINVCVCDVCHKRKILISCQRCLNGFLCAICTSTCIFFVYLFFFRMLFFFLLLLLSMALFIYLFRISGTQFPGVFGCRSFVSLMVWQIFLK